MIISDLMYLWRILIFHLKLYVDSELLYVAKAYVYAAYYHVGYISHHIEAVTCLKNIFRVVELLLGSIVERDEDDFCVCEN